MATSTSPYNSKDHYPRPDFVHQPHNWTPLNDGWSIIYDDEDVGLSESWHLTGLPATTTVTKVEPPATEEEAQRLAAFPELKQKGFRDARSVRAENKRKPINVPFTFQTPASGVGDNEAHELLWYERPGFADPRTTAQRDESRDRVVLRFGAVDYEVTVYVGGTSVGSHRGGHVPFDVDVTEALDAARRRGEAEKTSLILRVRDSPYDLAQPRGKQYWGPVPESIFYTPSSGIWQPVWVEVLPRARIGDSSDGTVLAATDVEKGVLQATVAVTGRRPGRAYAVEIEGSLQGAGIAPIACRKVDLPRDKDHVKIELPLSMSDQQLEALPKSVLEAVPRENPSCWRGNLAVWSVDHPTLYDLTIRLYDVAADGGSATAAVDEVQTYTGFRHIEWTRGDGTFRLNGEPVFQALFLDQGYWLETGLTPPSPDALRRDIELAKAVGFNGVRKHQKVEDPVFHYWADRLGFLIWGEMANAYEFSNEYQDRFDQEWMEAVRRDINHPSVVVWTPVNESWAYTSLKDNVEQRHHIRSLYYKTKALDPTRPINDNCGWEHVITDLSTFHDYHDAPELAETCATHEGIFAIKGEGTRPFFVDATPDGRDPATTHRPGAPIICSEFGGVNIAPGKGTGDFSDRDWGYTTASDPADLLRRIEALFMAVVHKGYVSGFVWTQLTDIEQEVNGMYSFDRREKVPAAEVKKLVQKAAKVYLGGVKP